MSAWTLCSFLRFYTGLYNYKSISTLRYGKQVAKEFWLVNAASPPMELALILEVSVDPPRITALTLPARCCAMAPATDRLWSKGGCYRRDRRTDWRTDTRPLHRPCTANYSGSVNNAFLHAIRAAISYISIKIVVYPGSSRQHASRLLGFRWWLYIGMHTLKEKRLELSTPKSAGVKSVPGP